MKDLSIPLRRIQLTSFIKNGNNHSANSNSEGIHSGSENHIDGTEGTDGEEGNDPALTGVKVAALNVLNAIVETLIFDIHYLSDSGLGTRLSANVHNIPNHCSPFQTSFCPLLLSKFPFLRFFVGVLTSIVKVGKSLSPTSTSESQLRMTLKAASDAYTDAMVDLGLAKTIQLAEIMEAGFERLENSVKRGVAGAGAGAGGGINLAAVGSGGGRIPCF